jgi:putative ABC transport system ATP-binding protein
MTTPVVTRAEPVIAAHAVAATKVYGQGATEARALDDITLSSISGTFTATVGPSGSGASTLLHCLASLDSLTLGHVDIGADDLSRLDDRHLTPLRRDRVGFVLRAYNLVPTLTPLENVTLPVRPAGRRPDSLRAVVTD